MKIASVICANGLGHYRRSIEILDRLRQQVQTSEITVFCETWQIERMKDWPKANVFWASGVNHVPGVIAPGIHWTTNESKLDGEFFTGWEQRLAQRKEIHNADLVLSDNLPGVLRIRSDAVLLGSFLWGEVFKSAFPQNPCARSYSTDELGLLRDHCPPMLCVGSFAMPMVLSETRHQSVGIMCSEEFRSAVDERPRSGVAILGDATAVGEDGIYKLVELLSRSEHRPLYIPASLSARFRRLEKGLRTRCSGPAENDVFESGHQIFDFSPACYARMEAIICRPGMGTVSDCIATETPMLAVYEPGNLEMAHNGKTIEQLGLGIDLGPLNSTDTAEKTLDQVCQSAERIRAQMRALDREGYEQAISWLETKASQ